MYEFSLSIDVGASPARVWRALTDPSEVVRWESGVRAALDAPADYPQPGQHVRWRTRPGPFRILHDRPVEVQPERRLGSLLALGPYRYDETYIVDPVAAGCRLTARVRVWAALPLIGHLVDRLHLGPKTRGEFKRALSSIKRHCEA